LGSKVAEAATLFSISEVHDASLYPCAQTEIWPDKSVLSKIATTNWLAPLREMGAVVLSGPPLIWANTSMHWAFDCGSTLTVASTAAPVFWEHAHAVGRHINNQARRSWFRVRSRMKASLSPKRVW
jgi:hypothetical protein